MSAPAAAKHNISKKRKFVADGVFYAELREFLSKELAEDGFSGVEVHAPAPFRQYRFPASCNAAPAGAQDTHQDRDHH